MREQSLRKRKRTTPAYAGDAPVQTKRKQRKRESKRVLADPIEHLNEDVVNILLGYLPTEDLVRCERVSRVWRGALNAWMGAIGSRVHFPHTWDAEQFNANSSASNYEAFKRQAHQQLAIQRGKLASVHRFTYTTQFVAAGDFVAWASPDQNDYLRWQSIPPSRSGEGCIGKHIAISAWKFLRAQNNRTIISYLVMNRDGIVALMLEVADHFRRYPKKRALVYSPADKKVFWSRYYEDFYSHLGPHPPAPVTPLLIGKRWVYCAEKNGDKFDLAAYDFRTGNLIYKSPSLGERSPEYIKSRTIYSPFDKNRGYELLQTRNGDELIFELLGAMGDTFSPSERSGISIIKGSDGQVVQKLPFLQGSIQSLAPDPPAKHVQIVTKPKFLDGLFQEHPALRTHQLFFVQRFSCHEGGLSFLSVDAIFSRETSRRVCVHPFTMSVISLIPPPHNPGSIHPPWNIYGHSLVAAARYLREAANAALQHQFPPSSDIPAVSQCFRISGENVGDDPGKALTLPPRPEIGRHRRVQLKVEHGDHSMSFLNGKVLRLSTSDHGRRYLMNFPLS